MNSRAGVTTRSKCKYQTLALDTEDRIELVSIAMEDSAEVEFKSGSASRDSTVSEVDGGGGEEGFISVPVSLDNAKLAHSVIWRSNNL
jgi:hypothetical protein